MSPPSLAMPLYLGMYKNYFGQNWYFDALCSPFYGINTTACGVIIIIIIINDKNNDVAFKIGDYAVRAHVVAYYYYYACSRETDESRSRRGISYFPQYSVVPDQSMVLPVPCNAQQLSRRESVITIVFPINNFFFFLYYFTWNFSRRLRCVVSQPRPVVRVCLPRTRASFYNTAVAAAAIMMSAKNNNFNDTDVDLHLKISNYEETVKHLDIYYGIGQYLGQSFWIFSQTD